MYDATWGPRRVALKVLHPSLIGTERVRAQFLAEATRLQQIAHQAVVKVLAVGELPDGRPYLAMERLEGETLADVLARGPLPLPQALRLFDELCDAVGALHVQGLVHRDLKPENVFIVAGAHAVLLDFGIAKELDAPASTTTMDGGVRGTPAYMAPERFFGQPAGVATDLYELAVTLYAMLAGRLPWDDLADPEARLQPRPLVELAPVPAELDIEIRRALSTRAQNRPATAVQFRDAVRAAIGSDGAAAPRPSDTARMGPASDKVTSDQPQHPPAPWFAERHKTTDRGKTPLAWAPTEAQPAGPAPRSRRRWPVVAAVIAVSAAAGGLAWWRLSDPPAPAPAVAVVTPADAQVFSPDDPWNAGPKAVAVSELPQTGEAVPVEVAREELAAAIRHVPADTQVLFTAVVGDLRGNTQYDAILGKLEKHPSVVELMAMIPCVRPIVRGSEWVIFAAKSLDESHHGTLIVRGRWRRADIERCFEVAVEPLKMNDGKTILEMSELGWIDFVDDHTVYLSVREDLAAAQVHDLAMAGTGPTKHAKELLAGLPAQRSITAIIDGSNGLVWPESYLPKGGDATAWFRVEDSHTTLDVVADPHDVQAATTLVAKVKPMFDDLFGDADPGIVGNLAVTRDRTRMRIRGRISSLMIAMISSALP